MIAGLRHPWLSCGGLLLAVTCTTIALAAGSIWDQPREDHHGSRAITVYRDASCACCSKWVEHLRAHRFEVTDVTVDDIVSVKQRYRVDGRLASCHTAVIDGYVIEGHVPADDIKRLLKEGPDITGLTVPGMPVGTPGMEMGGRRDAFSVYGFSPDDEPFVFRHYPQGTPGAPAPGP